MVLPLSFTTEHFVIARREHGGTGLRVYVQESDSVGVLKNTQDFRRLAMIFPTRREAEAAHRTLDPSWQICRVITELKEEA